MRLPVISLLIILSFFILPGLSASSRAQGVYSAKEQIYLKNITPLLYEFSQIATDVSASVLPLQSAPPEECASKFADYRGIINSLSGQLGSQTPPPRLVAVHSYAMQSLEGYSRGLGLYYNACNEKDYGVKESLVDQGGMYLNRSVATINKAYSEIEGIKTAPPVAKETTSEQITEAELSEGATSTTTAMNTQGKNTATKPAAHQAKTKAEVLAEISEKVQADMDANNAEEKASINKANEAVVMTSPVERRNRVAAPEPMVEAKMQEPQKVAAPVVKAPEPTVEPNPVPTTEPPALKSEEQAPSETASAGEENAGNTEVKKESEKPKGEETAKEKIERLNQKIMEQANAGESNASDVTGTSAAGKEAVKTTAENAEIGAPPQSESTETANTNNNAGEGESKDVALVPPGGTTEEIKEEEMPKDEIKSWCFERYDVQTERDDCVKKRTAAKEKVDKLSQSYKGGSKEKDVLDKCMSDWKDGGTYNYELVISCTQFFCTQRGIEDCKDLSK